MSRTFLSMMLLFGCSAVLVACSGGGGGGGGDGATTRATIGITGTNGAPDVARSGFITRAAGDNTVDGDDVDSLTLTITKIVLHHSGGDDDEEPVEETDATRDLDPEDPDDAEEEDDAGNSNRVVVFDDVVGIDVDIKHLDDISQIITTQNIPSGKYTKIVIYYTNPRLTLVADPETEIDDIHITANGRMFISQNFVLETDEPTLILLDFGGVHLTQNPSTMRYTLTPQLRVVISLEPAAIEFEGTITSIDDETMMLEVDNGVASRDIFANEETVIVRELPEDVEPPDAGRTVEDDEELITFEDLNVGDPVEVDGLAQVDGSIIADKIAVEDESDES
jgi:hypothetical protein